MRPYPVELFARLPKLTARLGPKSILTQMPPAPRKGYYGALVPFVQLSEVGRDLRAQGGLIELRGLVRVIQPAIPYLIASSHGPLVETVSQSTSCSTASGLFLLLH